MIGDGYGVFTSGGVGNKLHTPGAVALFVQNGTLVIRIKRNLTNPEGEYYKWKASAHVGEKKDEWLHLVGTWAEEGNLNLHINGVEVASANVTYFDRTPETGTKIGMQNVFKFFFIFLLDTLTCPTLRATGPVLDFW